MPNEPPTSLVIDAHLMLFDAEVLGEQVLHHVRRLRRVIRRHALLARIPVGDDGASFEADAGMAAEMERGLDHGVGFGERLVDLADVELALEGEVVAEFRMDDRRAGVERGLRVGDGRQFLVLDLDQLGGVFGQRARARDDGADGLALPAGALDRDRILRRRLDALEMREHADPRRHHRRKVRARDDRDDARRFLGRVGVHRM